MTKTLSWFGILSAICCVVITVTASPTARIVGGKVVDISTHPYLVSIRIKSFSSSPYIHKCGGSILTSKIIVTAAQCVLNLDSNSRLIVVAGANTRAGADGVQIPVAKTIAHAGYHFWTLDNDIGLVILDDELRLNDYNIKSIAIAEQPPRAGKWSTVSGWGWDAEDGAPTYFLQDVVIPIVSNDVCEQACGAGEITENMICAGQMEGGKDGCQHDTGGPLVVDEKLVGLVSWGRGCGRKGYPGVYTSVASHNDWIAQQIAENS